MLLGYGWMGASLRKTRTACDIGVGQGGHDLGGLAC